MYRIAISSLLSLLIFAGGVCALPFDCPMVGANMGDGGHSGCHESPSQVLKACCCDAELIAHVAQSVPGGRTLDPPMQANELLSLLVPTGKEPTPAFEVTPPPPDSKRLYRLSILLI